MYLEEWSFEGNLSEMPQPSVKRWWVKCLVSRWLSPPPLDHFSWLPSQFWPIRPALYSVESILPFNHRCVKCNTSHWWRNVGEEGSRHCRGLLIFKICLSLFCSLLFNSQILTESFICIRFWIIDVLWVIFHMLLCVRTPLNRCYVHYHVLYAICKLLCCRRCNALTTNGGIRWYVVSRYEK